MAIISDRLVLSLLEIDEDELKLSDSIDVDNKYKKQLNKIKG